MLQETDRCHPLRWDDNCANEQALKAYAAGYVSIVGGAGNVGLKTCEVHSEPEK